MYPLIAAFLILIITFFNSTNSQQKEILERPVNSESTELGPVFSYNCDTVYFTRIDHPGNTDKYDDQDIWYSVRDSAGDWTEAVNIGSPLNNTKKNFVCQTPFAGDTIYVGNEYYAYEVNKGGFSFSVKTDSGWCFPIKLDIENYYNYDNETSFFISSDGNTILMSIRRKDSYGDVDLYVSFRQGNLKWSNPLNLGPVINTKKEETTPFLSADGNTLYFSSKGHSGYGSGDIFYSVRIDSTWGKWSEPINMGPEINSEDWDGYYYLPMTGDYAYFVSYDRYGDGNIYRIKYKN